jgi:hypothetical protein
MITSTYQLVTPRRTATLETDDLRQEVRELHRDTSFRELADKLKVAANTLWRLTKGEKMRPSTCRRIRDGLARADEATAFEQFHSGLHGLLEHLSKPQRRKAELAVALALSSWFTKEGEGVPDWVTLLAKGQRKQSRPHAERVRVAKVEASSRGLRSQTSLLTRRGRTSTLQGL